jgi:PAS domain S-box-containing protein
MLNNLGCKVDVVPDGQKAVSALQSINYDMVLMDWNMPRMDGLEATAHIRDKQSNVLNHAVPIIALTSNTQPGDREKCLEAGMSDYLEKPVKKAYLAEVIEKWLNGPAMSDSASPDTSEPLAGLNSADLEQLEETLLRIKNLEQAVTEKTLEAEAAKEQLHTERVAHKNVEETLQLTCSAAETLNNQLQAEVDERKKAEKALEQAGIAAAALNEELQTQRDELCEAGKSLNESENKYRSIIQAAMDGFWMVDQAGKLVEVNTAYCQISGYSEPELLAMNVNELEVSDAAADITSYLHELITDGDDRFETQHRHKDGSVFDVEIRARYRTDESGLIVAFVRDITRQKETEEILHQARTSAEAVSEQLQAEYIRRADAEETLNLVRAAAEAANSETETVIKQMLVERNDGKNLEIKLEQTVTERTQELETTNELLKAERIALKNTEEKLEQARIAAETLNKQVEVVNEYLQAERAERELIESKLKQKKLLSARIWIFLITALVLLSVLAGGWYLFKVKPKSPLILDRSNKATPTATPKPVAKTPDAVKSSVAPVSAPTPASTQANKPVQTGAPKPVLTVPSFITVSGRDSKYSVENPGWERYVDAKHDIRIYRDTGQIKAVQVLAAKNQMIAEPFMQNVLLEVAGSDKYTFRSSELKEGFVIQRNSIGPQSRLNVYREKVTNKISAFVVQFE